MTTDKSQPTGWVVVNFAPKCLPEHVFRSPLRWSGEDVRYLRPYVREADARHFVDCMRSEYPALEPHPWPLPASVLARLKERHPTVDWSQVPVADAPAEKPGRWVMESLKPVTDRRYRDQFGWHATPDRVSSPWECLADLQAIMQTDHWSQHDYRPVNLDDLPAPAVAKPSEVKRLKAEIHRLQAEGRSSRLDVAFEAEVRRDTASEVETLRAEVERLTRERDEARAELEKTAQQRNEALSLYNCATQHKDELREELSRCKQAHSAAEDDVESLREQLGKATLSRRDEFAKAALTGMMARRWEYAGTTDLAESLVAYADATIRALDGAGGA